jgi:hypothetical protein
VREVLSRRIPKWYRYTVRYGPDGIGCAIVRAKSLLEAGAEFIRLYPGEEMTNITKGK